MTPSQINILYKSLFPKFLTWVQNNSGTEADAHDTFQEVLEMMVIKENNGKLKIHSSLESYTFQACKFRWIDQLRKRKRHGEVISLEESRLDNESTFYQDLTIMEEEKQRYELLDKTFSLLSDLCQKVLTLVRQGKKPAEIAELVGASGASTINRRKHACIESWRKNIQSLTSSNHE